MERGEPSDIEEELDELNPDLPSDMSSSPVLCILLSESITVEVRRKRRANEWPAEDKIDLAKWFLRCEFTYSWEWIETRASGVYQRFCDVEYQRVVSPLRLLAKYGMVPCRSGQTCSVSYLPQLSA